MNGVGEMAAGKFGKASSAEHRLKRLRQLNLLLWLCWLALPAWIGWVYWRVVTLIPAAVASASPGAEGCLRLLAHPSYLSVTGTVLSRFEFIFQHSIFFIVLWQLHRMVRKFISGQIFVEETLAGLNSLGLTLIVWPFLAAAVHYGVDATLRALGDYPPNWPFAVNVNVAVVAMGLFLLALKIVVEHAIDIKSDQELTI
jgi:Protein of unknown function (DUF2975)